MNLIVVTPPTVEPITLEHVYDHLRLSPTGSPPTHAQDEMLSRLITAARTDAENHTGRAFVEQTLMLVGDRVSSGIRLLRPPVIAIETVSYFDSVNALTEIDAANFYVTEGYAPLLRFGYDYAYPAVYGRPDAFRIQYRAGYEATSSPITDEAENVPQPLKQAILLGVEIQYGGMTPQEREALEKARDALLAPYVVHAIA